MLGFPCRNPSQQYPKIVLFILLVDISSTQSRQVSHIDFLQWLLLRITYLHFLRITLTNCILKLLHWLMYLGCYFWNCNVPQNGHTATWLKGKPWQSKEKILLKLQWYEEKKISPICNANWNQKCAVKFPFRAVVLNLFELAVERVALNNFVKKEKMYALLIKQILAWADTNGRNNKLNRCKACKFGILMSKTILGSNF